MLKSPNKIPLLRQCVWQCFSLYSPLFDFSELKSQIPFMKRGVIDFEANIFVGSFDKKSSISSPSAICEDISSEVDCKVDKAIVEEVKVCYFDNPSSFYIQCSMFNKRKFAKMCLRIAEAGSKIPDKLDNHCIYLGYHQQERLWHRCQIIEKSENQAYIVYLIDFGQNTKIFANNFRKITQEFGNMPPQCTHVSLYNVKPRGSNKWNDDSKAVMLEMIDNTSSLQMIQHSSEGRVHTVDIITADGISIRDALIYIGVGEEECVNYPITKTFVNTRTSLVSKNLPNFEIVQQKCDYRFSVHNFYIKDLSEFYVLKTDDKAVIKLLEEKMTCFYSKRENLKPLYKGDINMPCALLLKSTNKWVRAKILTFEQGLVSIKLVDYGQEINAKWKELFTLSDTFLQPHELAIGCTLADITYKENEEWSKETRHLFLNILKANNFYVYIKSFNNLIHEVVIYLDNGNKNVNEDLVSSNYAISTGPYSIKCEESSTKENPSQSSFHSTTQTSETKMPINRINVKISHIESPSELYIQLESHLGYIQSLYRELQEHQETFKELRHENRLDLAKTDIGTLCLVHVALQNKSSKMWYRAEIIQNIADSENMYLVKLIDFGPKVRISKAYKMNAHFARAANSAIPCHLACIVPTGKLTQWPATATDEIKRIFQTYEKVAAYTHSRKDTLGVILWGMSSTNINALFPVVVNWVNINEILVDMGLAHKEFSLSTEKCDNMIYQIPQGKIPLEDWSNFIDESLNILKAVAKEVEKIENTEIICYLKPPIVASSNVKYMQAKSISKTIFNGISTYVDNEAIIYLRDYEDGKIVDQMNRSIHNYLESKEWANNTLNKSSTCDVDWTVGQPCLAWFHFDEQYYRAQIISIEQEQDVMVRFVDFGNIEECPSTHLINVIAYPNIRIQTHKYKIFGIKPKFGCAQYSTHMLDFVHQSVVDKISSIRVHSQDTLDEISDDIKYCSMKMDTNEDIAEVLYINDLIECSQPQLRRRFDERRYINQKIDDTSINNKSLKKPLHNLSSEKFKGDFKLKGPEDYQKYFEWQEIQQIYKSVEKDYISAEDAVESQSSYEAYKSDQLKETGMELELSYDTFYPTRTSSIKLSETFGPFHFPKLDCKYRAFECIIRCIKSPTVFIIKPSIMEYEKIFRHLVKKLQAMAPKFKHLKKIIPYRACLYYSQDCKWHRAMIKSECVEGIQLILVDNMHTIFATPSELRECPSEFLNVPLKCLQVEHSGFKPARGGTRSRNLLLNEIKELFPKNKKVYTRVLSFGLKPKVQFYEDGEHTELIYKSLLEREYVKEY